MSHFVSGEGHVLYEEPDYEPEPDWRDFCLEDECRKESVHRCGCCGKPLCGMHHEIQGGFCSAFTRVPGTDFPGCVFFDDFIPFEHAHDRDEIYVTVGVLGEEDPPVYHIAEPDGDTLCESVGLADTHLARALRNDRVPCDECCDEAHRRIQEADDAA